MEHRPHQYPHERVAAERRFAGLKQRTMAELLGIDEATYRRIEQGKRELRVTELWRLARHFGLHVSVFYEGLNDEMARSA